VSARVSAMSYSVVNVDQIEGGGPGGSVRFVRQVLGVEAFGINWFELSPDAESREHDEIASIGRRVFEGSPNAG
jgi:hypothetical protein